MPEGGGRGPGPSRRGQRKPELLQQQPEVQDELDDRGDDSQTYDEGVPYDSLEDAQQLAGEQGPDDLPLLYTGDVVMGRASVSMQIHAQEAWFSWGVSSRIQPNESEEDAFIRIASAISMRILDLADGAEQEIGKYIERQREAERNRKIRPRQNR